jgi:hypothetical protein
MARTHSKPVEDAEVVAVEEVAEPAVATDELIVVLYDRLESYCFAASIQIDDADGKVALQDGQNRLTAAEVAILKKPEYEHIFRACTIK